MLNEDATGTAGIPDQRRNLPLLMADAAGFPLGMSLASYDTILPGFLGLFTRSPMVLGALATVVGLGWSGPSLLVANFLERLGRYRAFVIIMAAIERAGILMLAGVAFLVAPAHREWVIPLFLVGLVVHAFSLGCNSPAYISLVRKITTPTVRGRLYGISGAVGGLLSVVGAGIAAWLLKANQAQPARGYGWCFVLSFLLLSASVAPLAFVREPLGAGNSAPRRLGEYLREAITVSWRDRDFGKYLLSKMLFKVFQVAPLFYTGYALNQLGAPNRSVATFTALLTGGYAVGNLAWGWIGDHGGLRRVLLGGSVLAGAAATLALAAPSLNMYYWVFVVVGLANSAADIGHINIVMEFSDAHNVPTYSALSTTLMAPVFLAWPLLAGQLAGWLGYKAVFVVSACAAVGAYLFLLGMGEPRHRVLARAPAHAVGL